MFIAETRTFGFQNVYAHVEKQCWALPQTDPQIADSRFRFADLRKKIEIYRKFANQQHYWDRLCNFKTIRYYHSMSRQIWVDVFQNYNTLSSSFSAVERLFSRGAAILSAK